MYIYARRREGKKPHKNKQLVKEAGSAVRALLKQPIALTYKEH